MEYLYGRISEIARTYYGIKPATANKMVHETIVLACHEGLRGSGQAYGNLFSQVDFVCRKCRVRLADRMAVQALRRATNRAGALPKDELMYGLAALCRFVAAATGTDVPGELLRIMPMDAKPYTKAEGVDVRYVRCIVRGHDGTTVYVAPEKGLTGGLLAADCSAADLEYLAGMLREGMQLNLLDCKMPGRNEYGKPLPNGVEGVIVPGLVVVEPDCLVNISSIAATFKDYGHHPLSFIVAKMEPRQSSSAILLGNLAGTVLDGIVNDGDSFSLAGAIRSNFADKALEYCSCGDFEPEKFKQDIRMQAANIQEAVRLMFADHDRSLAVLEPSFVCERLGLQGRVDLMTTDFKLLVEQKSGKNYNIQTGRPGSHGSMQLEPHYVQLLLYYGVLRYNFNLGHDKTDIRLLYSKYSPRQGLMAVAFYRKLFREAIKLRNMIVETEFRIASGGFDKILSMLTPGTLNTAGLDNAFYNRWLLPQIKAVTDRLQGMDELEKEYFCRMATFAYREKILSDVGTQEGVGSCTADLWNMPLAEKTETGNIYSGLRITAKECGRHGDVPDLVTLAVPEQDDSFLPNFRRGDMVYLYKYRKDEEPDVRKAILYKGSITELHTAEIKVALANGQKNPLILAPQDGDDGFAYAVEHAGGEAGADLALKSLYDMVTAPDDRKGLLLGRRRPASDPSATLTKSYDKAYDDILLRVKRAKDYFLLVGPPGTGKTSKAIRFMVEEELASPGASILLMAYTNRAVDELCDMLGDAGIDYIRIGSEYSADPRFRANLLSEKMKRSPKLDDMKAMMASTRVITGTTSMMMSRPYVFDIKDFSLAIVDEASQILEPNIVGLLAAHRPDGCGQERCRIRKFVLTGDHKQLPAVVRQDEGDSAVKGGLLPGIHLDNCRNSLFERLLRTERAAGCGEFVGVLRRHGRMHPEVAEFPCHEFYSDECLSPVPLVHQRETSLHYAATGIADGLDRLLHSHRMIFIPSRTCRRPDLSDKVNTDEAAVVADILRRVRLMTGENFTPGKSVGVIVPYRNQIAVIRKEIEKFGMPELEEVSIDTVERYQGSQRDVIIYSFTVQNRWQLEFLAGSCFEEGGHTIDRKLNVALTRAKRQMIMTGNVEVLSANPVFRKLISYVESKGGVWHREPAQGAPEGTKGA